MKGIQAMVLKSDRRAPGRRSGGTPELPLSVVPFDGDEINHVHDRHLPHWEQPGVMYFITFRLADSVPQGIAEEWRRERDAWLKNHPEPRTPKQMDEFQRMFTEKMERLMDAGSGSCVLRDPRVSEIVEKALLFFDDQRYFLGKYVVMPNHVHLLVILRDGFSLSSVLHSWKSFTSKKISKLLAREGALWQDESYDHIVRSEAQRYHYEEYIEQNPIAAHLRPPAYCIGHGSAGILG